MGLSDLTSVEAVSSTSAWAAGGDSSVVRTTDGGATWVSTDTGLRHLGMVVGLSDIAARGASSAWVVGYRGKVARTTDGGATWTDLSFTTDQWLEGVDFPSATVGYIAATNGVVFRSADSGATWVPTDTGLADRSLFALDFVSATTGWAVGAGGAIVRTTDGAATWHQQHLGDGNQDFYGIAARDADHALAVGFDLGTSSALVATTSNGGVTWTVKHAPMGPLNGAELGADHAWIVGTGILRAAR